MLKKLKTKAKTIGDVSNNRFFGVVVYAILFIVSLFMTILNIFTHKGFLTYATGIFALLCIVNIVLTVINQRLALVAKWIFSVEVLCMFTFFLISGNPDGFSAIWICMLPSLGMIFFDRLRGTLLCSVMFAILAICLWTPFGAIINMYPYNETFKMRFPVLFVAFHLLAFFVETLRVNTYTEMKRVQDYYQDLSIRDQLTKVFNRQGMYSAIEVESQYRYAANISVAMFDIDNFKKINDKYGHNVGDTVLKEFAKILSSNLSAIICRWGGEEFVALFSDVDDEMIQLENVRKLIEKYQFSANDTTFSITASIGFTKKYDFDMKDIDSIIGNADEALYRAKTTGKNQIVYFEDLSLQKD